jgi:hypothetical protein
MLGESCDGSGLGDWHGGTETDEKENTRRCLHSGETGDHSRLHLMLVIFTT